MKFTKLSLAAIAAVGFASSAFAIENVKVDGDITLWYQTSDTTKGNLAASATAEADGLFKKDGARGDLAVKLRATGDLTKKVGFGVTFYGMTTSGLENNLVADVAAGSAANANTNGTTQNPYWLGEAYFTYKAGKTIAKIGRQELDTPLAFSEKWNVVPNTFEAAVLLNNDIKDTTLVGAYVARGNGTTDILAVNDKTVTSGATFSTFGTATGSTDGATQQGAFALGAVNASIKDVTLQAWYYNIVGSAKAVWLQADAKLPFGLSLGAQGANLEADGVVKTAIANDANNDYKTTMYAAQVGYNIASVVDLSLAYSNVSAGTLGVANYGTGGYDSKLYTASVWMNGSEADVSALKFGVGAKLGAFDLTASYAAYDYKKNEKGYINNRTAADATFKPNELNIVASTKVDDDNLTLAYVNVKDFNSDKQDLQAIRAIASIKF